MTMPTRRPSLSSRGPPDEPGRQLLFEKRKVSRLSSTRSRKRPSDQMTSLEPPGWPKVCTVSPGRRLAESPQAMVSLPAPGAKSRQASSSSRRAYFSTRWSVRVTLWMATRLLVAPPARTWQLVRIRSGPISTPEPVRLRCWMKNTDQAR